MAGAAMALASALCCRRAGGGEGSAALLAEAAATAFGEAVAIIFDDAGDFSFLGGIFVLRE